MSKSVKIISYKKTGNLGDAIQTIGMIEYLRKNNITNYSFAERDCLKNDMIINGWHRNNEEKLPNKATFISIHTDKNHLKNLHKNSIIGCRDYWTFQNCESVGLNCVITGCVTINLPIISNSKKSNDILFIGSTQNNISDNKKISQFIDQNMSWENQLLMAKNRLQKIASSSLVHTTRLHVLLSCIAMEIPVVLDTLPQYQPERFSFFLDYIPINKVIEKNSGIKDNLLDIWNTTTKEIVKF